MSLVIVISLFSSVFLLPLLLTLLYKFWLRIPEEVVVALYQANSGKLCDLLHSGDHWVNPFRQQIRIPTGFMNASGNCSAVTNDGIQVSISWMAMYKLAPDIVEVSFRQSMLYNLTQTARSVVPMRLEHRLQQLVREKSIDKFYQPGVHGRMEEQLLNALAQQLAPMGIVITGIILKPVQVPPSVSQSMEKAFANKLKIEYLQRLNDLASSLSEVGMARLAELERVAALQQANGVVIHSHQSESMADLLTTRKATHVNGNGHQI